MTIKPCNEKYQLPNGLFIYHHNIYETDFVFNEIFIDEVYFQHNIHVNDNAIVFDVGANIGLFSLFIMQKNKSSKVYAFEPAPEIYQILNANMVPYINSIKTYNCAISDEVKEGQFSYYPDFSVISGLHANQQRDAETIMCGMKANSCADLPQMESLVRNRLNKLKSIPCKITTLSKIIDQEHIDKIDLLKLDVEGSELSILNGIEENDWFKINQIVMEIHNKNHLNIINSLLINKKFRVILEPDKRLKNAEIYNVYAFRANNAC